MKKAVGEGGQRWNLARAQKSSFCPVTWTGHLSFLVLPSISPRGLGRQKPRNVEDAKWAVGFRVMGADTRQGEPNVSTAVAAGPELGDRLGV